MPFRLKWKDEKEPITICDGIEIDRSIYDITESRARLLFVKAVIVYLLVMGGLGSFLTSMNIDFSHIVVNVACLSTAIICALMYRSYLIENLGYTIFFAVVAAYIIMFRDYINSGFYVIVNDTLDVAVTYLDLPGRQDFQEKIADRSLSVTMFSIAFVIISNIVVNNYISRTMRYIVAAFLTSTILLLSMYFEKEPDTIYTIMYFTGIVSAYFYRGSKHNVQHRKNSVFRYNGKQIAYALEYKIGIQAILTAFVFILVLSTVVNRIFPKNTYASSRSDDAYKISTVEYATNLATYGLAGVMNFYQNSGGLNSGRLGGVSSIHLDYQTDIRLRYTPYSYDTFYVKDFTGKEYRPFDNFWKQDDNYTTPELYTSAEATALKKAYENGAQYSAMGKVKVTNVDTEIRHYLPYYSLDSNREMNPGNYFMYTYYPWMGANKINAAQEYYDDFLDVPDANVPTIMKFVDEVGLRGLEDDEIVDKVINYYVENIPYTIRPGATPNDADFVNYFLDKNKKGYCAHYASAATLIFRYMGIPARYCEGYAVSFDNVVDNGELLEEENYSDYYSGYSEMGKTGVVEVNVTDAAAHAWVEIYDKNKGWVICDVTPPGDEEDTVDFWNAFSNLANSDNNQTATNINAPNVKIDDYLMNRIAFIILALFIVSVIIFFVLRLRPYFEYRKALSDADYSDAIILRYQRYMDKLRKREDFDKVNYAEQIAYLRDNQMIEISDDDYNDIIKILERAGFSSESISVEEYNKVYNILFK